jgi:hypothetical protein
MNDTAIWCLLLTALTFGIAIGVAGTLIWYRQDDIETIAEWDEARHALQRCTR